MTTVSSSAGGAKLTFEGIHDLILGEDVHRRSAKESSRSLLSIEEKRRKSHRGRGGRGRSKSRKRGVSKNRKDVTCWNCKENGHFKNQCSKPLADNEKNEMNITTNA